MFSGTPPVPQGRARGRGRGPPLLPISSDVPILGKQFFDYPHHLTRPHCPSPCKFQMMLTPMAAHHYQQSPHTQRASTSALMMRGLTVGFTSASMQS
ncbi:UNVERIFIED_CONTAM: hypothetical protein Sindi_3018600 [Sesamum indicum]